jgi:hypothetical protein
MQWKGKGGRLTLFYTRGSEIVVLHVMVPQAYGFPPCFLKQVW